MPRLRLLVLTALVVILHSVPSRSATFTWDGGGSSDAITNSSNWTPNGSPPNNATATLKFIGSTRPTPDIPAGFLLRGLRFESVTTGFTLQGGFFHLGLDGLSVTSPHGAIVSLPVLLSADQTWTVSSGLLVDAGIALNGNTLTLDNTGGITFLGVLQNGPVMLTGTGPVDFASPDAGTVELSLEDGAHLVLESDQPVTEGSTIQTTGSVRIEPVFSMFMEAQLELTNTLLHLDGSNGASFRMGDAFTGQTGDLRGSGILNVSGPGEFRFATQSASTLSGIMNIDGGTLEIEADHLWFTSGLIDVGLSGGPEAELRIIGDDVLASTASPEVLDQGILTIEGTQSFNNLTIEGGRVEVQGLATPRVNVRPDPSDAPGVLAGILELSAVRETRVDCQTDSELLISADLTGDGVLHKIGAGRLEISSGTIEPTTTILAEVGGLYFRRPPNIIGGPGLVLVGDGLGDPEYLSTGVNGPALFLNTRLELNGVDWDGEQGGLQYVGEVIMDNVVSFIRLGNLIVDHRLVAHDDVSFRGFLNRANTVQFQQPDGHIEVALGKTFELQSIGLGTLGSQVWSKRGLGVLSLSNTFISPSPGSDNGRIEEGGLQIHDRHRFAELAIAGGANVRVESGGRADFDLLVLEDSSKLTGQGGQIFASSLVRGLFSTLQFDGTSLRLEEVIGDFESNGASVQASDFAPTDPSLAAVLHITGNATFTQDGEYSVTITGPDSGADCQQMLVDGDLSLDGALRILLAGYTPAIGDRYVLATASQVTGNFATITGSSLPGGLSWDITNDGSIVTLHAIGTATDAPATPPALSWRLDQNTPNPFNPMTSISYSIKSSGPVSLRIYDLWGREVRTLVDGTSSAGEHTVRWNGRDSSDRSVASGTYIYELATPLRRESRKMTLVR